MQKKIHVISNTHWDREHRHSFEVTRLMLVDLMDSLINIMENDPKYKFFTLDGQSIIIDDYLEVKPHMETRLKKLIHDGRILIGPWYSLADCFSVKPESIVRNLLYGNKTCKKYGEPMKVGYSIFSFGQIAQLPQIYNGFDISDIVFYKGATEKEIPKSEFLWKAPDGTTALTTRLGKEKRWNFFFFFSTPVIIGGNAFAPGWEAGFTDKKRLCHLNSEDYNHMYSCDLEDDNHVRKDELKNAVQKVLDSVSESASENIFLGFEGTDFTAPLKEIPKALKMANDICGDAVELVHSTPLMYFDEFRKDVDLEKLQKYEGEMRFGPVGHLHSETMGSNVEIKQAMFKAENMILSYAEPLSSMAYMNGDEYPFDMLNLAWKYLLSSQAHDSIHGAGDPQIKKDNLNRLEKVHHISEFIIKKEVENIARQININNFLSDDIILMVINPSQYDRSEIMKVCIDLPAAELVKDFWIEDMDGNRIEMYEHTKSEFKLAMIHSCIRPKTVPSLRRDVDIFAKDIPSMGYKLYKIKRIKGDPNGYPEPFPVGTFPHSSIAKSGNVLDNGILKLKINSDGTLSVYDYETKTLHDNINSFTDTGCSGDFWVHREPFMNQTISSKGFSTKISLVRNSFLKATYEIETKMEIPKSLNHNKEKRSSENTDLTIKTAVTLYANSKRVDFKTSILNMANEHMVCVNLPLNVMTNYAMAEAPFEIRKRDIGDITNINGKCGDELRRFTIENFVDISDDDKGVTLITKGLKEVEVIKEERVTINLTLLRSVSGTFPIHNDLFIGFENETSQCIGEHVFEYALFFHKKEENLQNVMKESKSYTAPLLSAEVGSGNGGTLPNITSFFKINTAAVNMNCMKLSEDKNGIIIRLNNPTAITKKCEISFLKNIKNAAKVKMNEEKICDLEIINNGLNLEIIPYKIETIYVEFS